MSRPLECRQVSERLEAYLDGELGVDAAAVTAHLEKCPGCTAELELASRIRAELRSWPELDTPPRVLREVFRTIGAERFGAAGERSLRRPAGRSPAWTALAAAGLAAVVLASGLYLASRRPEPSASPTPIAASAELDPTELDPDEIARATEEVRLAFATFARVSRRTGLKVRDEVLIDHLVKPSADTLGRALRPFTSGSSGGLTQPDTPPPDGEGERS